MLRAVCVLGNVIGASSFQYCVLTVRCCAVLCAVLCRALFRAVLPCAVFHVLCAVCCVLCAVCCVLCVRRFVLCAVQCAHSFVLMRMGRFNTMNEQNS